MKFYAKLDYQNKISPAYNSDYDVLKKIKKNKVIRWEAVDERGYEFHKKVMALFNLGFENQEQYNSYTHYRKVVTMKAGFYEAIETDRGTIYLPDSISYANMKQPDFEDLFSKVLDVIAKQLDSKPIDIRNQVDDFM